MNHIIESQQFKREYLEKLFAKATQLEQKAEPHLKGKVMAALFYEPSTRTRFSFESAMLRLGGHVLSTENATQFSSAAKGETLEDTIRVIGSYSDVIVMRHPEAGASERAAHVSSVPIINAGDGAGQHPTQALLDMYTIDRELGIIDGIKVAVVGDLKNGRTVRSLAYLLGKYSDIEITFVSPKSLSIGDDIKVYLKKHRVSFEETEDLAHVIPNVDVVYQTRIQKERFETTIDYMKVKGVYIINKKMAEHMKKSAILMHPLPRVDEIHPDVDELPQAVYFKQAFYGLLVRMALLKEVLM